VDDDLLYMRKDFGAPPRTLAAFPIDPHPSGWAVAQVRRHENGHARVARGCGGSARVDLRAGETYVYGRFTPTQHAAIASAGGRRRAARAAGRTTRSSTDGSRKVRTGPKPGASPAATPDRKEPYMLSVRTAALPARPPSGSLTDTTTCAR
jgi:hypothetical protein